MKKRAQRYYTTRVTDYNIIMPYHVCDAVVVGCIDFRFKDYMRTFFDSYLVGKQYDTIRFAGATKELFMVLSQIDISVRLHKIKQVVLVHHEDCGAYGRESTFEKHKEDLLKAKKVLHHLYPELVVDVFYMRMDGSCQQIYSVKTTEKKKPILT